MNINMISAAELKQIMQREKILLVDVRSEAEYRRGHIPGAINIPWTRLKQPYDRRNRTATVYLPREAKIVLYCDRGVTSLELCRQLIEEGYRAASLVGGYRGYRRDSY